jgi:hypothetical protein
MKKLLTVLGLFLGLVSFSFAQEKLLVVYLYEKNSSYFEKINKKILKNKYLSKKINKNFYFKEVLIGTKDAQILSNSFNIPQKEGVYFIDAKNKKVLYSVNDLSKPCKCANLVDYFSRRLDKKGISPNEYLVMAEKLKAYQVKYEENYLIY